MRLSISSLVTSSLVTSIFVFAHVQALETRDSEWEIGQTVSTSSGEVTGKDAGDDTDVSEYLGIPYAQPPVGDLRFAPPEKFEGSSKLDATKFGPSCSGKAAEVQVATPEQLALANLYPQYNIAKDLFNVKSQLSEDCLYLNVWTKPQVGEKKKAVLVWIHGGSFITGSSSLDIYNGRNIAASEDVVVVSLNYRLDIFGFPAHPNGTYNVAILDQRMAIEWVRDNIENFGGDPSRITVFGESAGGVSVDIHTYAWASDPIVSSAIIQSGTAFSWALPNTQSTTAKSWFEISQKLGCGNETSPHDGVIACMRTKTTNEIYNALPPLSATSILGLFGPTVDNTVVFANYTGLKPANIPMLIGNNDYEAGVFRADFALRGIKFSDYFWKDAILQEFTCPVSVRANVSLSEEIPVWRYRYMGVYPNLQVSSFSGAWHQAELPMIFNTLPPSPPTTPEQEATVKYFQDAWTKFAKDPINGLTEFGWPQYDPTHDTLARIGYNNTEGPNLIRPYRYDANCIFFNFSGTDPSVFLDYPDLGANVTPEDDYEPAPEETPSTISERPVSNTNGSNMISVPSIMILISIVSAFFTLFL